MEWIYYMYRIILCPSMLYPRIYYMYHVPKKWKTNQWLWFREDLVEHTEKQERMNWCLRRNVFPTLLLKMELLVFTVSRQWMICSRKSYKEKSIWENVLAGFWDPSIIRSITSLEIRVFFCKWGGEKSWKHWLFFLCA